MHSFRFVKFFAVVSTVTLAFVLSLVFAPSGAAQSLIAGDIVGTVSDPASAVVPNVSVNLKSLDTGATHSTTTNAEGFYRFTLIRPGRYEISASLPGFVKLVEVVTVEVGQATTANLKLEISATAQTIEVTSGAPLINPDASNNTSFTEAELQLLPSPGNDITNIAFTAPGVIVNVTGGFGNFTVNGLPATSNVFTVNGENDLDPYFNISNSGATNLLLGQNEIQEATVVTNPYAGEYGQLIGAQVTYVTKSGTNEFHGNALYNWNGATLNANDFFNNASGVARPFSNANQWAASLGGPVVKNKTFFYLDYEALRFILPNDILTTIPSPAFAAAVLANVQGKQPNEAPTYQTLFNLYANAKGASGAQELPTATNPHGNSNACAALNLPGFNPATQPCALRFHATPTALATEYIIAGKVDQKITDKDNLFFRYRADHGVQPTYLDPISTNFNALSNQPAWDAQANETHILNARSTNAFTATVSHYVAQFTQNQALALKTFPYDLSFSGSVPFSAFTLLRDFPQGRNVTQYQFIDDFTLTRGRHSLKFGENFRRYDVSDHNFFYTNPRVYFSSLQDFSNGIALQYRKALNPSPDVPVALWGIGVYAQDQWHILSNLTLTLALRVERNSDPVCQKNCFANFTGPFSTLATVKAGSNAGNIPYNQDIQSGLHQSYHGVDSVVWSPRVGFSWSPRNDNKLVVSGGIGIFYDNPAAGLVDDLLANPPASTTFRVRPNVLGFDPTSKGAAATWNAAAAAFSLSQSFNQIQANLGAIGVQFQPPAFTSLVGTIHAPQAQEWNLQVQKELNKSTALTINYTGNHVIRLPFTNSWANAFDQQGIYPGVAGINANAVVPNYGTVTQVQSGAISNYHGVSFVVREQFSQWLLGHFQYTYAHNLDEISNGGIFTYGDSLLGQINPTNLRTDNYGNSDYDIRHSVSADYIVSPRFHFGNKYVQQLVGGWQWSGKVFVRSGLPFSIVDGNWDGSEANGFGTILATPIGKQSGQPGSCSKSSVTTPCLNASAFLDSGATTFTNFTAFSPQRRNQYRSPHYASMDMALFKTFTFRERFKFGLGAQAFNVFNHPNFGQPNNSLVSGDSTFGTITSAVSTPTSPYGNFLGFDSSPRVMQLSLKVTF
jgi:Carboxypeptidase regulatory-like domain